MIPRVHLQGSSRGLPSNVGEGVRAAILGEQKRAYNEISAQRTMRRVYCTGTCDRLPACGYRPTASQMRRPALLRVQYGMATKSERHGLRDRGGRDRRRRGVRRLSTKAEKGETRSGARHSLALLSLRSSPSSALHHTV
jgi:hypothetical protein